MYCNKVQKRYSQYNSVTYLSQESRRGISSLGVKLGLWFKSLASRLRGCEPPMVEVLNLPLLAECSLEDSLLAGPESETRRAVTEENRHEFKRGGQSTIARLPDSGYRRKIHLRSLSTNEFCNIVNTIILQCSQVSSTLDIFKKREIFLFRREERNRI